MPNQHKLVQCQECQKYTRSDNLARHMERSHNSQVQAIIPSRKIGPQYEEEYTADVSPVDSGDEEEDTDGVSIRMERQQ